MSERGVGQDRTVLVTSRSFGSGTRDLTAELAAQGFTVVRGPATHDLESLAPALATAVAWIAGTGPVTEEHLALAPDLRVIARHGVGVESVDLDAARRCGITVTNTPGANSAAVADLTIGLLLVQLRGITLGDRRVRTGNWDVHRGRELGTMTVGIVGFGRIGRSVADRLAGFGSTVIVADPFVTSNDIDDSVSLGDLAELAERCDAVSLHAPGGARLIDAEWIAAARRSPVLINAARADLVDEDAVAVGLRDGRIGGYAADTLASEGHADGSPLLAEDLADRVIITPHLGAQTVEAVDRMGAAAVIEVVNILSGRPPIHPVI